MTGKTPHIGLFVTCLVDFFRPSVGFAAVGLLEAAGARVSVPGTQTCCGQPAYNAGDVKNAEKLARAFVDTFEGFDYVVAPSGSCTGMVVHHFPRLLAADPAYGARARALAARSFELVSFLTEVLKLKAVPAHFSDSVVLHDACAGLRELGIAAAPRALLDSVAGLARKELADAEACCGFGGTFCLKYPAISTRMADQKIADIVKSGAKTVVGGDLGCLLHLAGRIKRLGTDIRVRHIAEVLSGGADGPAIGEAADASRAER